MLLNASQNLKINKHIEPYSASVFLHRLFLLYRHSHTCSYGGIHMHTYAVYGGLKLIPGIFCKLALHSEGLLLSTAYQSPLIQPVSLSIVPCLCARSTGGHCVCLASTWVLSIQLLFSYLWDKYFIHWTTVLDTVYSLKKNPNLKAFEVVVIIFCRKC